MSTARTPRTMPAAWLTLSCTPARTRAAVSSTLSIVPLIASIDALGLLVRARGHGFDVDENRVDFLAEWRDLPRLEILDQRRHARIHDGAVDADADQHERLEHTDAGDDPKWNAQGM